MGSRTIWVIDHLFFIFYPEHCRHVICTCKQCFDRMRLSGGACGVLYRQKMFFYHLRWFAAMWSSSTHGVCKSNRDVWSPVNFFLPPSLFSLLLFVKYNTAPHICMYFILVPNIWISFLLLIFEWNFWFFFNYALELKLIIYGKFYFDTSPFNFWFLFGSFNTLVCKFEFVVNLSPN